MAPHATETPKPNANKTLTYLSLFFVSVPTYLYSTWKFVFGSRRGKTTPNHTFRSNFRKTCSVGKTPSSCIPLDSFTDPVRESELFRRIQSSIRQFDKSRFGRRFLSQIRDSHIRTRIHDLTASCSQIQIVTYGIGSINSRETSRLQLALVLRLKKELGAIATGPIQVFDPVLSAVECAVLVSLGCTIIANDEDCRREAAVPTLFYMPHCALFLYNNLLATNWKPAMLRRMIVLGNSFGAYDRHINFSRCMYGHSAFGPYCKHLLGIIRYVVEVEMEDLDNIQNLKKDKDELDFLIGFFGFSWHFFELDDDVDMNYLCK